MGEIVKPLPPEKVYERIRKSIEDLVSPLPPVERCRKLKEIHANVTKAGRLAWMDPERSRRVTMAISAVSELWSKYRCGSR